MEPSRVPRLAIPVDFGFDEGHEVLRESARRLLAERCEVAQLRRLLDDPLGHDPALMKELAELGWLGLSIPEVHGGAGLGALHRALLLEEMGRALLPGPFFADLLAGLALEAAGSEAQCARWLPAIASGDAVATLALCEPDGHWLPRGARATAEPSGDGFVLRGRKSFVLAAASANLVVAPFRMPDGALALFAVPLPSSRVEIEPEGVLDATRRSARLHFDGVRVGADARLEGDADAALAATERSGRAALAAEMVGGAEAVLDLTRDYAIERVQFGKPIGAFQAVKHPLVDMLTGIEMARSLAYAAAAALDHAPDSAETLSRMAKAQASEVFPAAAGKAVQLHGGFGFTWDCDVHLYLRRALTSRACLGDAPHHRSHLAAALFEGEAAGA